MAKELRYHSLTVSIYSHPGPPAILEANWGNELAQKEVQQAMQVAAAACQEEGIRCWLADCSELLPLSEMQMGWFAQEVAPALMQTGIGWVAQVLPRAIPGRAQLLALGPMLAEQHAQHGIQMRFFDERPAALAWLQAAS